MRTDGTKTRTASGAANRGLRDPTFDADPRRASSAGDRPGATGATDHASVDHESDPRARAWWTRGPSLRRRTGPATRRGGDARAGVRRGGESGGLEGRPLRRARGDADDPGL